MLRKTLKGKDFIGGNISNTSGLQHILSIGYEMECNNLMKLNKLESDELVLFNSDMTLNNLDFEEGDEDNIVRSQEIVDMDVIADNGNPDENASFSITNDIEGQARTHSIAEIKYHTPYEELVPKKYLFIIKWLNYLYSLKPKQLPNYNFLLKTLKSEVPDLDFENLNFEIKKKIEI